MEHSGVDTKARLAEKVLIQQCYNRVASNRVRTALEHSGAVAKARLAEKGVGSNGVTTIVQANPKNRVGILTWSPPKKAG